MSSRKGPKIQTKRSSLNKYKWERRTQYALRAMNKAKYYKFKNRGE